MPDLVLDLLKYVFLIMLYIFVARAVRAIVLELRAAPGQGAARVGGAQASRTASRRAKKAPRKLTVVAGSSLRGKTFDLANELTIGRDDKCHIVLDDTYVSQMHARIFARGEGYVLEDLGSTNGTYLNRKKVNSPMELQRGDQVKVGKSVMEMRK